MLTDSNQQIFDTPKQLTEHVSNLIIELADNAIQKNGYFSIALSGGKTPKQLYQRLASKSRKMNWSKTLIFFSDERYLPHDHRLSNYSMISENLLDLAPVPDHNIFAVDTYQPDPETAAAMYEKSILENVTSSENNIPSFDLILLGVGEDGHTASLFPNTKGQFESSDLVIRTHHQQTDTSRITFTLRLINNAQNVFILVTGKSKSGIIKALKQRLPEQKPRLPVEYVHALKKVTWFLDKEAFQ